MTRLDTINVSIGTVGVLGLDQVPMETAPTTAYLMLGGRCAMNCAFCAQARESAASALKLSRVTWPAYPLPEVAEGLRGAVQRGEIKRVCIQVTAGAGAFERTLEVVHALRRAVPDVPFNADILPQNMEQVDALFAAGLDHIGIGLDAASAEVFASVKGAHWARMWSTIEAISARYNGRLSAHVIVGLGETERDVVTVLRRLHGLGVLVGLFAFTPLHGTPLSARRQPSLDSYRRMQAARYLIFVRGLTLDGARFAASGALIDFGVPDLDILLADGEAFRTSGCRDCNRPFYNERPGGVIYNYPRPLMADEVRAALAQMWESPDNPVAETDADRHSRTAIG